MYADAKEQQARGRNEKTTSNTAIDPGEFPEYTEKVAKRLTTVLKDLPSDSVLKDLPSDSPLRKYYQEMASQLDEMARRYGSSLRPERVSPGGNGEPTLQVERPLVEEIRNSMTAGNMTLAAQAYFSALLGVQQVESAVACFESCPTASAVAPIAKRAAEYFRGNQVLAAQDAEQKQYAERVVATVNTLSSSTFAAFGSHPDSVARVSEGGVAVAVGAHNSYSVDLYQSAVQQQILKTARENFAALAAVDSKFKSYQEKLEGKATELSRVNDAQRAEYVASIRSGTPTPEAIKFYLASHAVHALCELSTAAREVSANKNNQIDTLFANLGAPEYAAIVRESKTTLFTAVVSHLEARANTLTSAPSDLQSFTTIAGKLAESNSQLAKVFGPELLRIAQQTIAAAGRAEQNIVSFQQDLATLLRALSLPAIFLPGGGIGASAFLTAAAGGVEATAPLVNAEYQSSDPKTAQEAFQQGLVKAVGDGVTAFALGTAASKLTPFLTHRLSLPLLQRGVPVANEIASTIANGVVGGATTFGFQKSAEFYAGITDPEIGSRTAGSAAINGFVSGIAASPLSPGKKAVLGLFTVAGVTYQQGNTGQELLNRFLANAQEGFFAYLGAGVGHTSGSIGQLRLQSPYGKEIIALNLPNNPTHGLAAHGVYRRGSRREYFSRERLVGVLNDPWSEFKRDSGLDQIVISRGPQTVTFRRGVTPDGTKVVQYALSEGSQGLSHRNLLPGDFATNWFDLGSSPTSPPRRAHFIDQNGNPTAIDQSVLSEILADPRRYLSPVNSADKKPSVLILDVGSYSFRYEHAGDHFKVSLTGVNDITVTKNYLPFHSLPTAANSPDIQMFNVPPRRYISEVIHKKNSSELEKSLTTDQIQRDPWLFGRVGLEGVSVTADIDGRRYIITPVANQDGVVTGVRFKTFGSQPKEHKTNPLKQADDLTQVLEENVASDDLVKAYDQNGEILQLSLNGTQVRELKNVIGTDLFDSHPNLSLLEIDSRKGYTIRIQRNSVQDGQKYSISKIFLGYEPSSAPDVYPLGENPWSRAPQIVVGIDGKASPGERRLSEQELRDPYRLEALLYDDKKPLKEIRINHPNGEQIVVSRSEELRKEGIEIKRVLPGGETTVVQHPRIGAVVGGAPRQIAIAGYTHGGQYTPLDEVVALNDPPTALQSAPRYSITRGDIRIDVIKNAQGVYSVWVNRRAANGEWYETKNYSNFTAKEHISLKDLLQGEEAVLPSQFRFLVSRGRNTETVRADDNPTAHQRLLEVFKDPHAFFEREKITRLEVNRVVFEKVANGGIRVDFNSDATAEFFPGDRLPTNWFDPLSPRTEGAPGQLVRGGEKTAMSQAEVDALVRDPFAYFYGTSSPLQRLKDRVAGSQPREVVVHADSHTDITYRAVQLENGQRGISVEQRTTHSTLYSQGKTLQSDQKLFDVSSEGSSTPGVIGGSSFSNLEAYDRLGNKSNATFTLNDAELFKKNPDLLKVTFVANGKRHTVLRNSDDSRLLFTEERPTLPTIGQKWQFGSDDPVAYQTHSALQRFLPQLRDANYPVTREQVVGGGADVWRDNVWHGNGQTSNIPANAKVTYSERARGFVRELPGEQRVTWLLNDFSAGIKGAGPINEQSRIVGHNGSEISYGIEGRAQSSVFRKFIEDPAGAFSNYRDVQRVEMSFPNKRERLVYERTPGGYRASLELDGKTLGVKEFELIRVGRVSVRNLTTPPEQVRNVLDDLKVMFDNPQLNTVYVDRNEKKLAFEKVQKDGVTFVSVKLLGLQGELVHHHGDFLPGSTTPTDWFSRDSQPQARAKQGYWVDATGQPTAIKESELNNILADLAGKLPKADGLRQYLPRSRSALVVEGDGYITKYQRKGDEITVTVLGQREHTNDEVKKNLGWQRVRKEQIYQVGVELPKTPEDFIRLGVQPQLVQANSVSLFGADGREIFLDVTPSQVRENPNLLFEPSFKNIEKIKLHSDGVEYTIERTVKDGLPAVKFSFGKENGFTLLKGEGLWSETVIGKTVNGSLVAVEMPLDKYLAPRKAMELLFNPEKPLVWVKLSTNGRQQFIARTTTEGEFSVLDGAGGSVTYKNIEGDAVPLNKVPTDSVRPRNSNESEPLSPEIRAELLQNPADFVSNNPNNIYSIAHKQYELSYQKAEYSGQEGTEVTLVRGRRYRESYFFKQGEAIPSPEELRTFDSTRVSTVDLLAAGRIEVEGGNGLHPPVTAERLRNDPDLIYREGYSKITVHSPFSGSLEITPSENGVRYSYQSYQQWDGNRSYSEKEFLKLIVGTDPVDVVWKEGDKSVYIKGAFSKSELAAPNFFATHPQIQEVRFDERDSGTLTRIVISRKESLDWQNEANVMTYSYKSVTEDVPFARGNSPWTTSSVVTTKRDGTVEISNGAEDPKAVLKDLPNLFQNQEIDAVRVAMPTGVNETVQIEVKRHDRQLATSEGMLVDGVDSQGERIRLFLSKGTPTYLCDASGISNAVSPPTKKLLTDEMFHPDTALKEYNEYTIKNPLNEFNVIRVTKLPNNQYSVSVSKVVAQELQTETKIYSLGSGQDLRNLVDLPQL